MENCYRTAESVKESGGEKEASQQHRKCYTVDDICEMLGISKNSVAQRSLRDGLSKSSPATSSSLKSSGKKI